MNDSVKDYLRTVQLWRLRDAKDAAQSLLKISEQTLKKIEQEGYDGHYSAHHDSLEKAQKLHRASSDLYRLKKLIEKIDEIEKNKKTSSKESQPNQPILNTPPPKRTSKNQKKK